MAKFSTIPAGSFLMGDNQGRANERPAHLVWIDSFDIAIYPVTRSEYTKFLHETGHELPHEWNLPSLSAPDLPVVGVSWHDAVTYCHWLEKLGQPSRLPTEAEWERAARGGKEHQQYPWGDTIPDWIPSHGRGPLDSPWSVHTGEPNDFGIYGISTNIHEWCADWLSPHDYATSQKHNPTGPKDGTRRASRGGAWRHALTISRLSARSGIDPSFRYNDYGFRIVRGD